MSEKTFAELLEQHIRENGYTNYEVAKAAKINRVNLQRYLSGVRVPSPDIFEAISSAIPMNREERVEFREAYDLAADGKDTYYLRKFIREMLEKVTDQTGTDSIQSYAENGRDEDEIQIIDGKISVERFIWSILAEYRAAENEKSALLYLPADKFFPGRIFPTYPINGKSALSRLKIIQMIPLSKRADQTEDQFYNLRVLRNLIPLYFHAGSSYETCYYYQKNAEKPGYGAIYPYYGIFENSVILFSEDMEHAVRIRNKEFVKKYREQFLSSVHGTAMKKFVTCFEDTVEMLEFLMKHDVERAEETERYFIEYQPCFALAADQKLMESVLQPKATERTNVLSGGVLRRAEIVRNSARLIQYFTQEGFEEFVETGVLAEYPKEYVRPLTVEERIQAIDCLLEFFDRDNIEFGMIRNECMHVKKTINVFLSSVCGLNLILNDEKQGLRHMLVDEPSICHAFYIFISRMAEKRDVLSKNETRTVLMEKRDFLAGLLEEKRNII